MNEYIGITVGPIVQTMEMTTTPAGLWAASYLFSYLTETLCNLLFDAGVSEEQIVSPYFSKMQKKQKSGIGQYHDRIIVRVSEGVPQLSSMQEIIVTAKQMLAVALQNETDSQEEKERLLCYIERYVRVVAFSFSTKEGESSFRASEKQFDSVELYAPIPEPEEINPLVRLFDSRGKERTFSSHNWRIKNSNLIKQEIDLEQWQLYENGMIRTLKSIAGDSEVTGMQASDYYAILRSDGDDMGRILRYVNTDEMQRMFSAHCIDYCQKTAEIIGDFGGVTIYSGGDDLLAIVPLVSLKQRKENGRRANVFDLLMQIKEINEEMLQSFVREMGLAETEKLTVSFGLSAIPHEYPLQNAIKHSSSMLFGVAKGAWKQTQKTKNSTAISVRSGERVGELLMRNECLPKITAFFDFMEEHPDFLSLLYPAIHKMQGAEASFLCAKTAGKKTLYQIMRLLFSYSYFHGQEFYHLISDLMLFCAEEETTMCALNSLAEPIESNEARSLIDFLNIAYLLLTKAEGLE